MPNIELGPTSWRTPNERQPILGKGAARTFVMVMFWIGVFVTAVWLLNAFGYGRLVNTITGEPSEIVGYQEYFAD